MEPKIKLVYMDEKGKIFERDLDTLHLLAIRFVTTDEVEIDVSFATRQDAQIPGSWLSILARSGTLNIHPKSANSVILKAAWGD